MQTPIKWQHNVSLEWLQARREYQILTASEVKKLIPAWKKVMGLSYRKTPITMDDVKNAKPKDTFENAPGLYENFVKVWASKASEVPLDTTSYEAAARGHIFEPYAIKQFNRDYDTNFFHWDDTLIRNKKKGIGYSPDGVSFKQPDNCPVVIEADIPTNEKYSILEIKCYDAGEHIMRNLTEQEQLEERWQLATAMVTDADIEKANLYFWNPTMDVCGIPVCYLREDLELEMAIIESLLNVYNGVKHLLNKSKAEYDVEPMFTIDEIATDYLKMQQDCQVALERMGC